MRKSGLIAALFLAPTAFAVDVAGNIGAIEVVGLPGPVHQGFYPYLGVSFVIPAGPVTVIPGLAFEFAPEDLHGGGVASVVADYALNDHVGLDVNLTLIHDQPGFHFDKAQFYLGLGVGASVFVGKWTFSLSLDPFYGLSNGNWSVVPGLNVARTF